MKGFSAMMGVRSMVTAGRPFSLWRASQHEGCDELPDETSAQECTGNAPRPCSCMLSCFATPLNRHAYNIHVD